MPIMTFTRLILTIAFLGLLFSGRIASPSENPQIPSVPSMSETSAVVHLPVPYLAQPDGNTCLPTTLLMALHFLGRADLTTPTVFALHADCQYDRYNIPAIAQRYGLYAFPSWLEHAWRPSTIQAELRAGRPVILGVDISRAGHFVLAIGYTADNRVIIHDPYQAEGGWITGGPDAIVSWDQLNWRNGIMLRTEPFPEPPRPLSATIEATTAPRTMMSGSQAEALISIKNNGSQPWPEDVVLRPVEAYGEDWAPAPRTSSLAIPEIPPSPSNPPSTSPPPTSIAPGEIALFRLPLQAPVVETPTVLRENLNLFSPSQGWFSDHWQSGPSNREIFLRLAIWPEPSSASQADQLAPFHYVRAGSLSPPAQAPPLPPQALAQGPLSLFQLQPDGSLPWAAAATGHPLDQSTTVAAWVWCDYRPTTHTHHRPVTRTGVFARDSGQLTYGPKTEVESGDSLIMAFDSDDGRLRVGNFARGSVEDWRPRSQATFITQTGWNHFAISLHHQTVTYRLNGEVLHVQDLQSTRALDVSDYKLTPLFQNGMAGVFVTHLVPAPGASSSADPASDPASPLSRDSPSSHLGLFAEFFHESSQP
jgi:hypothetical protein